MPSQQGHSHSGAKAGTDRGANAPVRKREGCKMAKNTKMYFREGNVCLIVENSFCDSDKDCTKCLFAQSHLIGKMIGDTILNAATFLSDTLVAKTDTD